MEVLSASPPQKGIDYDLKPSQVVLSRQYQWETISLQYFIKTT